MQERMEQDFMGLRTVKVKQEVPEEPIDPVPVRDPMMRRWSFSKNLPDKPQFFSFDSTAGAAAVPGSKDDKPKTGFEALASTGLVTITTTESVDSTHKSFSQKTVVVDNQGASHYTLPSFPAKPFDALHRPHEARVVPLTTPANQTISMTMTSPVHQSFISPAAQNLIGSTIPQPLSLTNSVPVARSSPVVGTTELRSTPKASGTPAQLTIFYAGSVCVYDDISPEKAQAIMLLAGNAPPTASIPAVPAIPVQSIPPVPTVQAPIVRSSIIDSFVVNQSHSSKPSIPTTISMTCHTPALDVTPLRSIRTLPSPPNKGEPPKQTSTLGSAPAKLVGSAAVPQFRQASLARFLEKRKARTLKAAPYPVENHSQDCGSPAASGSRSISVNSSGSCAALPAIN